MISDEEIQTARDFYTSEIKDTFLQHNVSDLSSYQIFSYAKSSLLIFIQENSTGPPQGLPRWSSEGLELQGEEVISYLLGGEYMKAASWVFIDNFDKISDQDNSILWRGRCAFLYQQILTHPVQKLKDLVLESYANVNHSALTLVEYSRCLLYYSQYEQAESVLVDAEVKTGIQYGLTGKLGVRTKFQKFKTAQLVLEVTSKIEDQKSVPAPASVPLEEDCPLHETPKLDEVTREIVSIEDQILLIAWVNLFFKTRPSEELQAEVISSYLDKILNKSLDWLVYSQALLYRSKNQFVNVKFKERSALQINTLVEQYTDKTPEDRIKYFFPVGYPLRHWLKVDLGEMFLKIGALMSAFQEFETVEMWEEAVECLIMSNFSGKAKDLALEKLAEKRTPRMLCALGDITGDLELYEEAWEISRHRCTRAQRTLAKRSFDKGQYLQAIEHYKKALEINPLYPSSWFTLSCAYMRLEDWPNAQISLQHLIIVDPNLPEAWNNLAAVHSTMGNIEEAYNALIQGIKHDRNNWKMLENLLIMSVKLGKYYTSIETLNYLIKMNQIRLIDSDLFGILNKLSIGKEKSLKDLYALLVSTITVEPGIWKCYGDFVEKNLGLYKEFTIEMTLDLRLKACRAALTKDMNKELAEKIEGLAQDLQVAYGKMDNDKVKYEGKLFLASLVKKIRDALGRDVVLDKI